MCRSSANGAIPGSTHNYIVIKKNTTTAQIRENQQGELRSKLGITIVKLVS